MAGRLCTDDEVCAWAQIDARRLRQLIAEGTQAGLDAPYFVLGLRDVGVMQTC